MKIAIISINMYSKGLNFACPLHTYAFQQLLFKHGYDNTVLDYKPVYYNNFDLEHPSVYYDGLYAAMEKQIRDDKEEKLAVFAEKRDAYQALYQEREIRYKKFQSFIDRHYIKTSECYNSDLLEVCDPGFDCYICATDVIWKNEPGFGFDRGFFLGSRAMENKWKIAYAASAGRWYANTEEESSTFFHYINDIDFISVREPSLKSYIEKNSSKNVVTVLDPVLLHDKEFYEKIAIRPQEKNYLLLYHVVEDAVDTIEQAAKYAASNGLTLVEITDKPLQTGKAAKYIDNTVYRYDIGVEEWLGYILNAKCVFTNSFHGCCFSILFEKELFVGYRLEDKVDNLLNIFEINHRKINPDADILSDIYSEIDYDRVKEILMGYRKKSLEVLFSSIETCKGSRHNIKEYQDWKKKQVYQIGYNSQTKREQSSEVYTQFYGGELKFLESGNIEFRPLKVYTNTGQERFENNYFSRCGYSPKGWKLRVRIDREWFWYLEDGSLYPKNTYRKADNPAIKCFSETAYIPYISVNHISLMIAEAVWKKRAETFRIIYNSGKKGRRIFSLYDRKTGTVKRLSTGSLEYNPDGSVENSGKVHFQQNKFRFFGRAKFSGWRLRVRTGAHWFWYLENGTLVLKEQYSTQKCEKIKVFSEEEIIPFLPLNHIETVVAEAVWKKPD